MISNRLKSSLILIGMMGALFIIFEVVTTHLIESKLQDAIRDLTDEEEFREWVSSVERRLDE